jgi:hypothetical protein
MASRASDLGGLIMKVGDSVTVLIHGHSVSAVIVAIHSFGTVDVKTSAGYFRVSGLGV